MKLSNKTLMYVYGISAIISWIGGLVMLISGLVLENPAVAGGSSGVFITAMAATIGSNAMYQKSKKNANGTTEIKKMPLKDTMDNTV